MLENRSFDHMLGFMKRARPELNGLTGNESNSTDLNDVNNPTKRVKVSPDANNINDVLSVDAGHKFADVNTQLFCNPGGPPAGPEKWLRKTEQRYKWNSGYKAGPRSVWQERSF